MRLIDADALKEWVETEEERKWGLSTDEVWDAIEAAPTIDAMTVVRCKDCEFYTEEERWCRRLGLCGAFDLNGYCSHAERNEK